MTEPVDSAERTANSGSADDPTTGTGTDTDSSGFGHGLVGLTGGHAVPALLGAVLVVYFVGPFVAFFLQVGSVDVTERLAEPATRAAIRTSLVTAPVSTTIATVFGIPLAYVLSRRSFRGKRLVEAAVLLPLVLPPIVGGVMILTVVGQYTPIGSVAASLGLPLTDSYAGVILAQTFVAAPFLVVTARAGFDGVDERLEEAARTLGYCPLSTARRVTLPLARNAIAAGVILTFVRAIGEFGATMMVAYNPRTMPTRIEVLRITHGLDAIVPIALALLVITLVVVVAVQFVIGGPRHY
ncbi:ABC transporter permease subunit [Natronorubrum aibiense]|uniref:ABC transporter permease subunit n=1 Tax=Natronorubrum aibiense TaxID=348826 RepID=A0A5P9P5X4_9EURY|nr:ABC transporter permease subunit [Natronorubrum aibiense]